MIKWIISLFIVSPWWLKLLVILFVIGIFEKVGETIREANRKKDREAGKLKVSEQISSNPKLAVQIAENKWSTGTFKTNEYENCLIEIVQNTGCVSAMLKLVELYGADDPAYKQFADKEKRKYWQKKAAEAGDIASIRDYYGFLKYDVSSDAYNQILTDLDNAKAVSEDEAKLVNYMKGIVNYKIGNYETAKQLFMSVSGVENEREYMLFRCYMAEKNIDEVERILAELLDKEFELPAADHLSLFNYYNGIMGATKTDYVKALACASRYANAKDANPKTAKEILGNTFYQIAVAYQNGSNGFEKDISQCIMSYKYAAEYGNVEAMGYFGMCLWTGSHDNMGIYRNYHQANKYLFRAAQKGHKNSEEILAQYGVDGILVVPMHAESITYQFMDGHQLTASAENMKWVQLYAGISYKAFQISDEFEAIYYKTFKTFDDLINGIYGVYADQVAKMLKWGGQLLMFFNIDMYSANDILDECEDLSLLSRVPGFEHGIETIDSRAAELNLKTAYAQASRKQWSGVGFGTTIRSTINASVQASVAAGVMNIGSGILYGIGDSIVESINNSEIKNMGKKLFEDPVTFQEFNRAVVTACFDVGCVIRRIIAKHCGIALSKLDGKIKFGSEELANIDEKTLNAKIINNLSAKKFEYTYALVIEKLRRFPTDSETLENLFMLTLYRITSLKADSMEIDKLDRYAGDADLDLEGYKNKIMQQMKKDKPELFAEA